MTNKENFMHVIKNKEMTDMIPLWELHFHLWKKYDDTFVTGPEFNNLDDAEKINAIKNDAKIMKKVGEEIGFGCVSIPDAPWNCIYTLPPEYRAMLIRELKALSPDFCIAAGCNGVICMPSSADDYMKFCFWIMDEPEEIDAYCEEIFNKFKIEVMELINAGADVIYLPADVADNRTTFFNRAQLERWYFPYLKKSVDFLHEKGVAVILHTDGNVNSILADLLKSDIDAYQAVDPVAKMDIKNVLEQFDGKVAVCGNFDCGLMLMGTPETIYNSAKEILLACRDKKGWVFGNANAVVIETEMDHYLAMVDAWKKYGRRNAV